MIRVGVIGVGHMGSHHARVYASSPGLCRLTAVYDIDYGRAEATAERWGAQAYRDLDAFFDAVDAVSIVSPTAEHFQHAMQALESGLDVLIEKPVTLTIRQAQQLVEYVRSMSRPPVVQVGHIEHYNPAVGELRKLLETERIVTFEMQRLGPYDGRMHGVDVVQDLMIHDIHVMLTLVKSPLRAVQAMGRRVRSEDVDYAVANFHFADDVIATLVASRITEEKVRRLALSTSDAFVTVDYLQRTVNICRSASLRNDRGSRTYRQESVVEKVFVPLEEPLVAEIQDFLRCVQERRTPHVTLEMGLQCLEVVEAVRSQVAAATDYARSR